jgi:hypothetical protein
MTLILPSEFFRFDFKSKTIESNVTTADTKIEPKLEDRLDASWLTRFGISITSTQPIKEAIRYFFPVNFKDGT